MTTLPHRALLAAIVSLTAPVPCRAQASDIARAIDGYVAALAADTQFSGAILVARGGNVLLEKAYGRRDFALPEPNTTSTLFAVASLTKPLTGIIARTLASRGELPLDATIDRWLPGFPGGDRITVTHLLGHRSGIPHRVTTLQDEQAAQTAASMLALIAKAPRAFDTPGAQRLYSSAGFSVLARVLELASGKSYATLLHEIVLSPAGATAAVDATEVVRADRPRARGHFWMPGRPMPGVDKNLAFLVGAGSLWATPRDLFAVTRHIASGGYAGVTTGARAEDGTIEWTGFSNGSFAWVVYRPAIDVTLVVTSNLLTGAIDAIMRDVPRIVAGEPVPEFRAPRAAVVSLAGSRRAQLMGTYNYFGNRQQLEFLSPSAALLGGEYILLATSDTSFFAPQNYSEYIVDADSAGVRALRLNAPNGFSITRVR